MTGTSPCRRKEIIVATIRAYPKHPGEPVEWTLPEGADPAEVGGGLYKALAGGDTMSIPIATGWAIIDTRAYASFQLIV